MTLTDAMKALGPGATIIYVGKELADTYWVEIRLPTERYNRVFATAGDSDPDKALAKAVAEALVYKTSFSLN